MDDDTVDSPVGNNGQGPNGRFAAGNGIGHRFRAGNKYGKGNPNARRSHELRRIFLEAIEPATIVALAKRLQVQALQGDLDAIKMLLDQGIGRAPQGVEVTGADGEPLGIGVASLTTVVMGALAGDEHASARIALAARFKELASDARDRDDV